MTVAPIAHEVESWEESSGSLAAWIHIPTFHVDEATTVFLYYGNPNAVDSSAPAAVWTDVVSATWHLNTEPLVVDSGPGGLSGTPVNGPSLVAANVGQGLLFDGTSRVDLATPDPLRFGDASFSFSVWVFITASLGEFDMPFYFGGSSPLTAGYDFELGADEWVAGVGDGVGDQAARFGVESSFLGRWVYLVAVVDRENGEFVAYADGLRKGSETLTVGDVLPTTRATIGAEETGDFALSGVVDEMRVYPRALTADWITTVHANLSNPSAFLTVGPQESLPDD